MSGELSGLLKQRIRFERPCASIEADGGQNADWHGTASAWAAISAAGEGAAWAGNTPSAMPRYHVVLRRRTDIQLGDQILWRGQRLTILQIIDDPTQPDRITLLTEVLR